MAGKLIRLFITLPLAVVLITLAVSNRHQAVLVLDPFASKTVTQTSEAAAQKSATGAPLCLSYMLKEPAIYLKQPLYVYLFGAMLIGVLMGGISVWFSQSRWRKTARRRTREAQQWRKEADRLTRQLASATAQAAPNTSQVALPSPT